MIDERNIKTKLVKCGKAVCDKLGLKRNYFYIMRCTNPTLFIHIANINMDFSISYPKYIQRLEEAYKVHNLIYYYLSDTRGMRYSFSKLLSSKGIYTNPLSYITSNSVGTKEYKLPRLSDVTRIEKTIEVFKEVVDKQLFIQYYSKYRDSSMDSLVEKYLDIGINKEQL